KRAALLVATLAALAAAAGAAFAHAFLDRALPAVGSTVHGPPAEVTPWFSQALEPAFSTVRALDRTGKQVDRRHERAGPQARAVTHPALEATAQASADETLARRRRTIRVSACCLALVFASGALWLLVQAASMSGATIARALDRETLGAALAGTLFGRTWIVRF